jgi:ATP-dependent exoDNAse (exonuclease V) alpha subunit
MDEQRIHIVNGEQWVVVGHRDDGRLALQHARSGVEVAWDMAAYPEVDWSMATTSYRSQGRTVDAAYALVTESDARRGLYVDITRAREDVLVVYAREDLVDFGEFLAVGGRERAKMTVAATQRYIAEHEARTEVPSR